MRRSRWLVLGVVAALLVVAGWFFWPRSSSPWEEAIDRLPGSVLKVAYTDWTAVADEAESEGSPDERVASVFDTGLTVASALSQSADAMDENWGITPFDAEWEAYGQGRDGAVDVLKLGSDVSLDDLEERFEEMGYTAPSDGPGSDGVWTGTPELVAGLDVPFSTLQENVAVVRDERLLLMADDPAFLESAVEVASGDGSSLASSVSGLLSVTEAPAAAFLWAADFACEDLAMSQADTTDADRADELVSSVGGVNPLEGLVMAQEPSGDVRVAMAFSSSDAASEDLQPRTDLASGEAIGQGGTFPERFEVVDAVADGEVVTLSLEPVDGPLLGDIGQGPVLFATC